MMFVCVNIIRTSACVSRALYEHMCLNIWWVMCYGKVYT